MRHSANQVLGKMQVWQRGTRLELRDILVILLEIQ
jgi:hypothetical protein